MEKYTLVSDDCIPIIELKDMPKNIVLTNRVIIYANVDGQINKPFDGEIVNNDEGIITLKLDNGELKVFDCRYEGESNGED